jgi:replicative DNA helicase
MQFGPIDHLFKETEAPAYAYVRGHVKQYGGLPDKDTIEAHTGEVLVKHKEPSAYYYDIMVLAHAERTIKVAMKAASDLLLAENGKDINGAVAHLADKVMQLMSQKHAKQIVDFRDAYDLVVADYIKKLKGGDEIGLRMGWPYLDKMSGGLVKGDVISFVGRPAAGKTFQMLYGAHHGWSKAGTKKDPEQDHSRLFVSMEMGVLPIEQRLAAMQLSLPMTQVQHAALSSSNFKILKEGLVEVKGFGAPFYIVDGNLAAMVEDIWGIARQLKPAAIFLDGAYLVKHPRERDRYKRVAENADLIKSELAPIAPVCCSWQFAKTAAKKDKKKGEKPTLEDIGYTDVIAQVSSLVLGVFEDDSIETIKRRKVEVLKGRSGETGSFLTNWDFKKMDFDEVEQVEVEDMQFI